MKTRLTTMAIVCALLASASGTSGAEAKKPAPRVYKYAERALRPGDRGPDVRALQFYLAKISLPPGVDGLYGPATRHSVKAYEITTKTPVDGLVQRGQARKIRTAAKRKPAIATGPFVFPVPGAHSFGNAANAFGAPRDGHVHQGQDVLAACGLPLLAAQGGTIRANAFQVAAGNYVVIRGAVTGEDYFYAHLGLRSPLLIGTAVTAGQVIGAVGQTGDASGCHLHFEMWTLPGWYLGGSPYDPLPSLLTWDAYS